METSQDTSGSADAHTRFTQEAPAQPCRCRGARPTMPVSRRDARFCRESVIGKIGALVTASGSRVSHLRMLKSSARMCPTPPRADSVAHSATAKQHRLSLRPRGQAAARLSAWRRSGSRGTPARPSGVEYSRQASADRGLRLRERVDAVEQDRRGADKAAPLRLSLGTDDRARHGSRHSRVRDSGRDQLSGDRLVRTLRHDQQLDLQHHGRYLPSQRSRPPINRFRCHPRRSTPARRMRNPSRTRPPGRSPPWSSICHACWCTKWAHRRHSRTSGWSPRWTIRSGISTVLQHQHRAFPSSAPSTVVTGSALTSPVCAQPPHPCSAPPRPSQRRQHPTHRQARIPVPCPFASHGGSGCRTMGG